MVNARRSIERWNSTPASSGGPGIPAKSEGIVWTTRPEFAKPEALRNRDIPFVTTPPGSDEQAITSPPGHMQNV